MLSLLVASMWLMGSAGGARADGPRPEPTLAPGSSPSGAVDVAPTVVEGYTGCVTWSKMTTVTGPDGLTPITFVEEFTSCRDRLPAR